MMGQRFHADLNGAAVGSGSFRDVEDNAELFEGATWVYRTPRLRALGFDFAVQTSRAVVGRYLHDLLDAFEMRGEPEHMYSFLDAEHSRSGRYEVYRDEELVSATTSCVTALRHLLWDVNRSVVDESNELLLFHASAVEHAGRALVFPGPMGSGKTTLVAGLVQRGLGYLTDEVVAIDPVTLMVRPYPKPLGVDPGSWEVLAALRPKVDTSLEPFLEDGWDVRPNSIRERAIAPSAVPRYVIAPRFEDGAATGLVEMRRSEALIRLAENSFNLPTFGARRGMEVAAEVVRSARCFRLLVSDLGDACSIVLALLNGPPSEGNFGVDVARPP